MITLNENLADQFKQSLIRLGRQPSTVQSYLRDILNFMKFIETEGVLPSALGLKSLEEFKDWQINKGSKSSSVRRSIISVRLFFRWMESEGKLFNNPFEDAVIPSHENLKARKLAPQDVEHILSLARLEPSPLKSSRDLCLIYLISREGLKATEIVRLQWSHFWGAQEHGRLVIPGDRARSIELESETSQALLAYRQLLAKDPRTESWPLTQAPLFVSFKGADAISVHPGLSRHGLKFAIYELGAGAGFKMLNGEQLRHFAMGHKLAKGWSIDKVMNHFGLRRVGNISKHIDHIPNDLTDQLSNSSQNP